jgi:hypothetical protein
MSYQHQSHADDGTVARPQSVFPLAEAQHQRCRQKERDADALEHAPTPRAVHGLHDAGEQDSDENEQEPADRCPIEESIGAALPGYGQTDAGKKEEQRRARSPEDGACDDERLAGRSGAGPPEAQMHLEHQEHRKAPERIHRIDAPCAFGHLKAS